MGGCQHVALVFGTPTPMAAADYCGNLPPLSEVCDDHCLETSGNNGTREGDTRTYECDAGWNMGDVYPVVYVCSSERYWKPDNYDYSFLECIGVPFPPQACPLPRGMG